MTTQDKAMIIELQNYYAALSERAHRASRKKGLADHIAGYSSGRADALHEVCEHLAKLMEAGEIEV